MDYRVSQRNSDGRWLGSTLAESDQQARQMAEGMLLPGGRMVVGRWDPEAKDFYDYAELRWSEQEAEWWSV